MISKCSNPACDNIFQHPRGVDQGFCCKLCRTAGFVKSRKKFKKLKSMVAGYKRATEISDKLKKVHHG